VIASVIAAAMMIAIVAVNISVTSKMCVVEFLAIDILIYLEDYPFVCSFCWFPRLVD
jgi:hypothetical protein